VGWWTLLSPSQFQGLFLPKEKNRRALRVQKKIILIYSNSLDPISQVLLEQKDLVIPISVKSFLDSTEIFDQIREGVPQISWTLIDGTVLQNTDNFILVNRVLDLKKDLFNDFREEDREFAYQEFWAYLSFALANFPLRTATPTHLGLSGANASLPIQWNIVSTSGEPITTPSFYYGPGKTLEAHLPLAESIISNLYSYNLWKPNGLKHVLSNDNVFAYRRPRGEPLSILTSGNQVMTKQSGSNNLPHFVTKTALKISELFSMGISEQLYFIDSDKITFGYISPLVSTRMSQDKQFKTFIINSLQTVGQPHCEVSQ